jgi:hypothetical protein
MYNPDMEKKVMIRAIILYIGLLLKTTKSALIIVQADII